MRNVTVAATQMACSWDREATLQKADRLVREAAEKGANIILLQELFETPYFCQKHEFEHMELSMPLEKNPAVAHFKEVAKELDVVLPISFFERAGNVMYNSIAIIDADGTVLGVYRKTHIPDGAPYAEKFIFHPETPDLKYGKQNTEPSVSVSVGISGSQRPHGVWHLWELRF